MAIYTESKTNLGLSVSPENAIATPYARQEPLLTPAQLRKRQLWGIPLVSKTKDPYTGKPFVMDDTILADIIERAIPIVEVEGHFIIYPTKFRQKLAFDRNTFDSLGYMEVQYRPVASIDRLSVTPSNGVDVYQVPNDWVETANIQRGQINIVPLTIAFTNGGYIPSQSSGGAAFLSILGTKGWIPAYWQVEYTSGFPDGQVPKEVNELIGCYAGILALSELATTDAESTSKSVSIDGISQSVGGLGPNKYDARIKVLEDQKKMLIGKIRSRYGTKLFTSNV